MSSDKTQKPARTWLSPPDYANVAIRIRLAEYLEFSERISQQLERLERCWAGQAAPRAHRGAMPRR